MLTRRRLEGLTALVTGCNRGLGKAILTALSNEGCNVIACTRSTTPELLEYYRRLEEKNGVSIKSVLFDLSNDESIKTGMKQVYKLTKSLDILVNNAGVVNTDGLMRLKMEEARKVMQINYFAPLLITQWMLKLLMKSKNASIINMSSVAAVKPTVGNTVYGASKAALASMTTCWAKELGPSGIRVNAIAPGYIDTDMSSSIDKTVMDGLIADTALRRMGSPEDVAAGVVFLASEDAKYVDGHTLTIGGGI